MVTNFHVIARCRTAAVILADNTNLEITGALAVDREADLALLKVDIQNCPCLTVADGAPPAIGTRVYAIGNPLGLTNTLSEGLISGVREAGQGSRLQTTAQISCGSSGGPLLTADGRTVGVAVSTIVGGQNLNLAVPAERVRKLMAGAGRLRPLVRVTGGGAPPADN